MIVTKQIAQFFNADGSLIHIPARSSKKIEVLNRIALTLDPSMKYTEKELNQVLSRFHSDTASLRRHMIEFGVMQRDSASNYWLVNR